mgnify:CR=1 FL=1
MKVHRLVAMMHIPNPHEYPEVNHKNGDKLWNGVNNLEWATREKNHQHAKELGKLNGFWNTKLGRSIVASGGLGNFLADKEKCKAMWGEKLFETEMDGTRPILKPDYHTIAFKTLTLEGEEDCIEYINKTMI